MSAPQMTTVDVLRQAIAETLSIDAQGLQAAIGQLVVATSAECPGAGPDVRSLSDPQTRTTVLLADRIPAGQEAQALATEIERHHGRQAAQAVLGERANELLGGDGKVPNSIEKPEAFFDSNGLLRSWETADPMPPGWTGIAKRKDTLFFVGQERQEMTYSALQAKTMVDAHKEVAVRNLQVSRELSALTTDDFDEETVMSDNGLGMSGSFAIESEDGRFRLTATLSPHEPDAADEDRRAQCTLVVVLEDVVRGEKLRDDSEYEYHGDDYGDHLQDEFDSGVLLSSLYDRQADARKQAAADSMSVATAEQSPSYT